jgi:hypothetical protein
LPRGGPGPSESPPDGGQTSPPCLAVVGALALAAGGFAGWLLTLPAGWQRVPALDKARAGLRRRSFRAALMVE